MNSPSVKKSEDFAVDIVNLSRSLVQGQKETVLSRQILRSGTSIGANIAEAQRGQSKADFISKMNIALKEASETQYWLKLLYRTDYISKEKYDDLDFKCEELIKILSSIIKTSNS